MEQKLDLRIKKTYIALSNAFLEMIMVIFLFVILLAFASKHEYNKEKGVWFLWQIQLLFMQE